MQQQSTPNRKWSPLTSDIINLGGWGEFHRQINLNGRDPGQFFLRGGVTEREREIRRGANVKASGTDKYCPLVVEGRRCNSTSDSRGEIFSRCSKSVVLGRRNGVKDNQRLKKIIHIRNLGRSSHSGTTSWRTWWRTPMTPHTDVRRSLWSSEGRRAVRQAMRGVCWETHNDSSKQQWWWVQMHQGMFTVSGTLPDMRWAYFVCSKKKKSKNKTRNVKKDPVAAGLPSHLSFLFVKVQTHLPPTQKNTIQKLLK